MPGPTGPGAIIQNLSDDPEDPLQTPGVQGPPGQRGAQGLSGSALALYPDDPDDPAPPIPGAPGLAGAPGVQGIPGASFALYPDDPDDPAPPIPGTPGAVGATGARGASGVNVPLYPEDPDDPYPPIPGAAGAQGPAGMAGVPGIVVPLYAEDADDVMPIPGNQGLPGTPGAQGLPGSALALYPDDPDDPALPVPGGQGPQGIAGAMGPQGITVFLTPDDPDDPNPIPGAQGVQGVQGIPGVGGSSAGGWAAQFALDDNFEDFVPWGRVDPGAGERVTGPFIVNGSQNILGALGLGIYSPAATKTNVLTWAETGQTTWQLYLPASSNDSHWYNNAIGDVLVMFNAGAISVPGGGFQVKGVSAVGFSGKGVELAFDGTNGIIQSYDRTNAVWIPSLYDASVHGFYISGGAAAAFSITATALTQAINSSAFSTAINGVNGIVVSNASSSAQSAIEFQANGALRGRIRSDYVGNLNYVAQGGGHSFFYGGDTGFGTVGFSIDNGGNLTLGPTSATITTMNQTTLNIPNNTVATSATAGTASALPMLPAGFLTVSIHGTVRKIPYYAN